MYLSNIYSKYVFFSYFLNNNTKQVELFTISSSPSIFKKEKSISLSALIEFFFFEKYVYYNINFKKFLTNKKSFYSFNNKFIYYFFNFIYTTFLNFFKPFFFIDKFFYTNKLNLNLFPIKLINNLFYITIFSIRQKKKPVLNYITSSFYNKSVTIFQNHSYLFFYGFYKNYISNL